MPLKIAEAACENDVASFLVISSIGTDAKSSNFYLKTKGELEEAIQKLSFKKSSVLQPSMLLGDRKEFRFLEFLSKKLIQGLGFLFTGSLKKYRAIHANDVAKAMIVIANSEFPAKTFRSDRIQEIAKSVNNI